jgi:Tol biopolymer transport system component
LRVIKASGGPSTVLARDGTVNESPAFSHDGRRIAFSSNRAGKPESAYVEGVRKTPGSEGLPRSGAHDIYVVGVDGKGLTRLTSDPSANYSPTWSPDDRHLAFISDRDDNHNLFVMAADGTNVVRLSALEASSPSWLT